MKTELFVPGKPAPQGSKKLMGKVMVEASKAVAPWRARVMVLAQQAVPDGWQRNLPMVVAVEFVLPRGKGHWSRRGGLLPSAPKDPTGRVGDVDKLARAILDGLTGVAFDDDAQVVLLEASKRYQSDPEERIGAWIRVTPCT